MDEVAPLEWNRMQSATCQNEYYSKLSQIEQAAVDSWVHRRSSLIQLKSQRIIYQRLETETGMSWNSSRFIKINVRALVRRGDNSDSSVTVKDGNEAILTLWDPSEEQLSLLQEGAVLHFQNVAVKEKKIDNLLQLSIRGKAKMEVILPPPPLESLYLSGYRKREHHTLVQAHLESRRLTASSIQSPECDVIGYLLKVTKISLDDNTRFLIYMTDQTGLVLRIERDSFDCKENELIHWGKNSHELGQGLILYLFDIRIRPYDPFQGCAVGIWTKSSSCQKVKSDPNHIKLKDWTESSDGKEVCDLNIDRMNLHFPASGKLPKQYAIIIGKIMNVRRGGGKDVMEIMDIESSELLINVDVGTGHAMELILPNELLSQVLMICQVETRSNNTNQRKSGNQADGILEIMNEHLTRAASGYHHKDAFLHFLVHITQGIGKVTQIKSIQNEHLIKLHTHFRPCDQI